MILDEILPRLKNIKKSGNGYSAKCPCHEDQKNSLSVTVESDKLLLYCHAGCSVNDICAALNIELKELFLSTNQSKNNGKKEQKKIVAVYEYRDETGKLLYENVRFDPKKFIHRRFDEDGKIVWNLKGTRRVPYRLPELIKALEQNPEEIIFHCEGERDVENLLRLGFTATSLKNWKPEFNLFIKGANIVILPDHDKSGLKQAEAAIKIIQSAAKTIKLIDLFENEDLPEKHGKDISDWLELGHTKDELEAIVKTSDNFKPIRKKVGYTFGELLKLDLPDYEKIIRGLGRGEVGLINAITDVGKTTLKRNLSVCLITGRQFPPLTVTNKPRRVCIIDTEDTPGKLRNDVQKMIVSFTNEEKKLVEENLLLICEPPELDGEVRLNQSDHFDLIVKEINEFQADVVFVDTISSSFTIKNENDNGEIKEHVMKPLKRLARKTNAVVLGAHHIGKLKLEEGGTKEGAHKGRGASSFGDLSKVVFNLEKDAKGDVVLSCGKLKGEGFANTVLRYDKDRRWFTRQGENKSPISFYEMVLELFEDDSVYRRGEIDEMLEDEMSKATITRNLADAIECEDLFRKKGFYSKNAQMLTSISNEQMSKNGNGKPKGKKSSVQKGGSSNSKKCEKCLQPVENYTDRCRHCGELPLDI